MLDRSLSRFITIFCACLLCGVLIWTCSGCYSKKIAEQQTNKAQGQYPEMVAKMCGLWYPPKESKVTETKYLPGVPIPGKTNYVTVDCDSAINSKAPANNNSAGNQKPKNTFKVPCPPCDSLRVDSFIHKEIKTVENTAKIVDLESQIESLKVYEVVMWCLSALLLIVFIILLITLKKMKNGNK